MTKHVRAAKPFRPTIGRSPEQPNRSSKAVAEAVSVPTTAADAAKRTTTRRVKGGGGSAGIGRATKSSEPESAGWMEEEDGGQSNDLDNRSERSRKRARLHGNPADEEDMSS